MSRPRMGYNPENCPQMEAGQMNPQHEMNMYNPSQQHHLLRQQNNYCQNGQYHPNFPTQMNDMNQMNHNISNRMNDWNWGTIAGHDSGIHTRESSAAQSVMSGHSMYSALSGSNYSDNIDWMRYQNNHRNNLNRNEDEIKKIKASIDRAIESLSQSQDVEHILPLLSKYLVDDDLRCTYLAAKAILDLSKIERYLPVLRTKQSFWQGVMRALDKTDTDVIAKELTRIIYTLTSKDGNQGRSFCNLICMCDGLRILIKMLDASVDTVVYCSVTSLHNIVTKLSVNEKDGNPNPKSPILSTFREKHGVVVVSKKMHERFIHLRNNIDDPKFQTKVQTAIKFIIISLAILHTAAYKCQRTKDQLLHEQVPDLVVNIIQVLSYHEKLSYYAIKLLKVLSVCQNNKARIVESGGISTLGSLIEMNLQQETTHRQTNTVHALWTLRNLSDEASRQPRDYSHQKVIDVLVRLIQRKDLTTRNLSCGILYNLICRNHENKVLLITQFNGIDIFIQRIDEILRTGTQKSTENKAAIVDILESCIATLRILAKENEYFPEQNDIARQTHHHLRSNQACFNVISTLYLQTHDFSQHKKILAETLRLLVNIFANRGFDHVPNKSILQHFIQRTLHLTKHYRENYTNDQSQDEIIMKLTQLITIFCSNPQLKKYIHNELLKLNILRYFINDTQHLPKDRQMWFYSAELLYELKNEITKEQGSDNFWQSIEMGVVNRRLQAESRMSTARLIPYPPNQNSNPEYYNVSWQQNNTNNDYMYGGLYNMSGHNVPDVPLGHIPAENNMGYFTNIQHSATLTPPMTPMGPAHPQQSHPQTHQQAQPPAQQPPPQQPHPHPPTNSLAPNLHNMNSSQHALPRQPAPYMMMSNNYEPNPPPSEANQGPTQIDSQIGDIFQNIPETPINQFEQPSFVIEDWYENSTIN